MLVIEFAVRPSARGALNILKEQPSCLPHPRGSRKLPLAQPGCSFFFVERNGLELSLALCS
jgi:hypothetical protein